MDSRIANVCGLIALQRVLALRMRCKESPSLTNARQGATKAEGKPRRPREEIPEFEDPSAELAKLNQDMVRSWATRSFFHGSC